MNRLLFAFLFLAGLQAQDARRVEVSRDLWVSAYETEREGNNGGSPKLKLKGNQEFFLIDFDPQPFQGQRCRRAQLHLHLEGPETLGRITVATVAEEWVEGTGTGYAKSPGATSYLWLRTGEQRWRDVDLTGSTLGQAGTIWSFGDAAPPDRAGWQVIPIDPAVIQARIDGQSHGFFVMDDVGSEYTRNGTTIDYKQFPNRYVASREGKKAVQPYFTLWMEHGAPFRAASWPAEETASKAGEPKFQWPELPVAARPTKLPVECRDEFGEPLQALEFFGARGETLGFSVTGANPADVRLEVRGIVPTLYSMPKVGGKVDPLVPVGWTHAPAGTENGGTFVDLHIPKTFKPGRFEGLLRVGGHRIPVGLTVWEFSMPDHLSFYPQMNCYGLPQGQERAYYRLAHQHRTILNCLPYGWTGKVRAAPEIQTDGTWDWEKWDAAYGPLFDGSAFADLPRGAVPVEAFYLPLNENWPMNHEAMFKGGYWVESAYQNEYWAQFRAAVGKFAEHVQAKQWKGTMFEFYLNNKVYFKRDRGNRWDACSAPWIFDEPMHTQDFWALRRFGLEFWNGVAPYASRGRFEFRADISRPEWQRDLLDGVTSVEIVSGALRTYRDRVIDRADRFGNLVFMYGSANPIGTPNVVPAAWCVETWALGADGVVPWQTVGNEGSWTAPDPLSLFYPTPGGPVPSLRLKSFRAGQQLVEYLNHFRGPSRTQLGKAILGEPGMRATLQKKSEADAGSSLFDAATHRSLIALRLRIGPHLDHRATPKPPRPGGRDPAQVRPVTALPSPVPLPVTVSE